MSLLFGVHGEKMTGFGRHVRNRRLSSISRRFAKSPLDNRLSRAYYKELFSVEGSPCQASHAQARVKLEQSYGA
jgi:hypothetical protein